MSAKIANIVVDTGSCMTKYGLAGEYEPKCFPTSIGDGPSPVEKGKVNDWDAIEKLWHRIADKELNTRSGERRILLAESPANPRPNREKATEIMFESLDVAGFHIGMDAVLSLYATGQKDGLVVESGHGVTHVVAAHEGNPLFDSILPVDVASGAQVEAELSTLLAAAGVKAQDPAALRKVKEACCGVAVDFDKDVAAQLAKEETHKLPDGTDVKVDKWKYDCTEQMFAAQASIQSAICDVIGKCDKGLSPGLYGHIAISGGNTLLSGFQARLEKEMATLVPAGTKVRVVAPPTRGHNAWIGGSVLAGLDVFQPMWISKEEYKESGPAIVQKKCI